MIYAVIKNTLDTLLGIDEAIIHPSAMIKKDLQLDSTESVVIALELKKRFGVDYRFPTDDISLADICKEVEPLVEVVV